MNAHDSGFRSELENEKDGDELRAVWELLGRHTPADTDVRVDSESAWEALAGRLEASAEQSGAPDVIPISASTRRPRTDATASSRTLVRAAAVAAVIMVGGLAWQNVPVVRSAPAGQQLAVTLPDGSEALLNAGSSLRYRRGFATIPGIPSALRDVELSGEAFFDVERGERTFQVRAGDARVRVLGTRFNVRARASGSAVPESALAPVRVEVEEGSVEVSSFSAARLGASVEGVVLEPGQAVRVDPRTGVMAYEAVRIDRVASWRDGGLTMVDETLLAIADELSLRFGAPVVLADSVDGIRRMSVYYPALQSLESVLGDLATQQGLGFRRTSDGWELF